MPLPFFKHGRTVMGTGTRRKAASWAETIWYAPISGPLHALALKGLTPASWLYSRGLRSLQRKAIEQSRRLPVLTLSVGNLVVGGTGKTPVTLWIASHLCARGWRPAILSRGYGRSSREIARVPGEGQTSLQARRFGDEPVLLARKAPSVPVWVGSDRRLSGQMAIESSGVDALILDDGFQHLRLERDVDLVLLDAKNPLGNGLLLPAGPLREPIDHLDRAHALILTRAEDPDAARNARKYLRGRFPGKPVFTCRHRLTGLRSGLDGPAVPPEAVRGRSAVAFAGIAHPDSFFRLLPELGIKLAECLPFPDHHRYHKSDIHRMLSGTRRCRASFLITTQKDMARLPPEVQSFVLSAELDIVFDSDLQPFCDFLDGSAPVTPPFSGRGTWLPAIRSIRP